MPVLTAVLGFAAAILAYNVLVLLQRTMYGRADFDLLRARVLHAA